MIIFSCHWSSLVSCGALGPGYSLFPFVMWSACSLFFDFTQPAANVLCCSLCMPHVSLIYCQSDVSDSAYNFSEPLFAAVTVNIWMSECQSPPLPIFALHSTASFCIHGIYDISTFHIPPCSVSLPVFVAVTVSFCRRIDCHVGHCQFMYPEFYRHCPLLSSLVFSLHLLQKEAFYWYLLTRGLLLCCMF